MTREAGCSMPNQWPYTERLTRVRVPIFSTVDKAMIYMMIYILSILWLPEPNLFSFFCLFFFFLFNYASSLLRANWIAVNTYTFHEHIQYCCLIVETVSLKDSTISVQSVEVSVRNFHRHSGCTWSGWQWLSWMSRAVFERERPAIFSQRGRPSTYDIPITR
jgi:hypothetical protein